MQGNYLQSLCWPKLEAGFEGVSTAVVEVAHAPAPWASMGRLRGPLGVSHAATKSACGEKMGKETEVTYRHNSGNGRPTSSGLN